MSPRWASEGNPYGSVGMGDGPPARFVHDAPPRCKCSHAKSNHSTRTGDCWNGACGCAEYRPQETT
jgi:hypothetical protein